MKQLSKQLFIAAAIVGLSAAPVLHAAPCTMRAGSPRQVIAGLDKSTSIDPGQWQAWGLDLQKLVSALCPGDSFEVFAISSQTLNAKPFFLGVLPAAPLSGATLQQLVLFRKAVTAFRSDADTALSQAARKGIASNGTDIFSVLDRIHRESSRRLEVVLFTDGIQANAELNLERVRLKKTEFAPLIRRLSDRHGWASTTLAGADVQVVLPSIEKDGNNAGPNDRILLKAFYTELFSALGGTLTSFDTQIGGDL